MAARFYLVDLRCPQCEQLHRVTSGLIIRDGPTEAGIVADLYADAELPLSLASLLNDAQWCEKDGGRMPLSDPARLLLTPSRFL